ncbi:uncharacterized protein PAE49_002215 [Odontesthes bonariensis]|uniref:uncharacterized protein LOC142374684 n=1 Tax=Odontesthes bonariensis TaxID=219752 RepID=UPI003F58E50F
MAAAAVRGELRLRDGQTRNISVPVENNLKSLITGLHELNGNVAQLLNELVEREGARGAGAPGTEDEDSDEEDGESNSEVQPPPKRSRS